MDLNDVGLDKLVSLLESDNMELKELGIQITESIFGDFPHYNKHHHMVTYIKHMQWFKELTKNDIHDNRGDKQITSDDN